MKKTFQIWAVTRTGTDSAATQPLVAFDSLSSCMEVVELHRELRAERGMIIPESEAVLIPHRGLCQKEHSGGTVAYRLLDITHIQEAWV